MNMDNGHSSIDFGCLDAWTVDTWTLDDWTLGLWTPGLWTLGPRKFFPFLVTSISFFSLFNIEFLDISNALRLAYYGSVERAANGYYNLNLLQLIL